MSAGEIVALIASGVVAGAINAVAGGGTLITFSTLLFCNTPPVIANATSTLALFAGTAGSVYGYRKHLALVRHWLWRFLPVSIAGGLIGSALLTRTSDEAFSKLIPFLILFATVVFLLQGIVSRSVPRGMETRDKPQYVWVAIAFQFAVSIYGGYFGAGIGILMLAALGFIGLSNIHEMNTLKTVLSSLINLVASVWFICAGLIDWPKAALMTAGALVGYYLGSHYAQRIPPNRVRQIITVVGLTLTVVMFYKEFIVK